MIQRLALPLLLAALALAAWLFLLGGGPDGPGPAEDGEPSSAAADGADAAAGGGLGGDETAGARTVVADGGGAGGGLGDPFAHPRLGIPSFVGRVLSSDGVPAAGAEVRAIGLAGWGGARDRQDLAERLGADWTLRTRADGRFAIPEAPQDGLRFEIVVNEDRHAPLRLQNLPSWPGRTRDLGDLTLARGFTVLGRVLSPEGRPVAGAAVAAYPDLTATSPGADLGQVDPLPVPPVATDREGAFVLERLGPGRVRLRAAADDGFSPWSAAFGAREGETVTDVELQLLPAEPLAGVVLSEVRLPVAGARVTAEAQTGLPAPNQRFELQTRSGEDGSFRFALPAGTRSVQLRAGGEGTWIAERQLDRPEQWRERVELVLKAMPALRGRVTREAGGAASGARVALAARANPGQPPDESSILAGAVAGADGAFELLVDLSATRDSRFRVVAWDGRSVPATSDVLRMRADGRGFAEPTLELVLLEGFSLSGRALDPAGAPLAGARALLRKLSAPRGGRGPALEPTRRGGQVIASRTTGADGGFRFEGLIAGDYRIELHHRAWSPAESQDLPVVESLEGLDLSLHAPCGIAGEIDGDLQAVPVLQVTLSAPGRDPLIAPVDARGTFLFSGIAPDVYALELHPAPLALDETVFAFPGGRALGRLDQLEVPEGQVVGATLRLELEERGAVSGEVRAAGSSAANHSLFLLRAEATTDADPRVAAREAMRNMRATQTDHQGRYRIAGLESGDYVLVVCAPGGWPSGLWSDDGTRDPRGWTRRYLSVDAGGETRADFLLRGGTLRIEVANGDASVSGVQAELVPLPTSDEGWPRGIYVGRRGATVQALPSGQYLLRYGKDRDQRSWQTFVPADAEGRLTIELPERGGGNR